MNTPRPNDRLIGHLPRLAAATLCLATLLLFAVPLRAEPYLAIQEGYKCSKCHVNMTGGGKRTDFANVYVQARLANQFYDWRKADPEAEAQAEEDENPFRTDASSSFFSGRLNDYIAIGGDFRFLLERSEVSGEPTQDTFNQRKQNIYLEIDLIPERVIFYQTLSGGGDAREIFGLVKGEFGTAPYYFKAGQFFLPYGLRLQDDTAFTRAVTGFTYGTTDVGLEVGFEPGPLAIHVAATNGTGSNTETNANKRITSSLAYVSKRFRVGASYSTNRDTSGETTVISGVHAGAQFGRLGLLAEVDVIDQPDDEQLVSILEFNLLLSRGNNLKLSYEYHDPSRDLSENARERYSLVWEPFLYQFVQLRTGYRDNQGIPQSPEQNANEFFAEMHLLF